ncbi:MAG: hypothetical protein N2Z64_07695 [Dictyoglomus thermophilum]|nr:hypothetical protein [Dictyoglomus thermophilum]MCX7721146.1 hypothetical protein [Dictyoglomus thermophilum]
MYKIKWDKETSGILLSYSAEDTIILPRPVYFEELDLLGFDKYWDYPKLVAEVRGVNVFEDPKVILTDSGKELGLELINIGEMFEKNQEVLKVLENETIDFVNNIYKKYS